MLTPVIMAGGSGSRLWPLSRSAFPKQFLSLDKNNSNTMLQETFDRISTVSSNDAFVITNENHRFIVAEQLRKANYKANIILEPEGKNTAPAIALAAFKAISDGSDPILLILASDHFIKDKVAFRKSIKQALVPAEEGMMVTFGIIPVIPETGYGYIKRGGAYNKNSYLVSRFVEKPNLSNAKEYIDSKEYYWNSGCFMFKASVFLNELKKFSPDIYKHCKEAIDNSTKDSDFIRIAKDCFSKSPEESIDYAVMEHTSKAVVVPMDAGWSDVGSWSALWDISEKDENGNVIEGDVIDKDSKNCYIYAPNKLVASVGIENIIVIDTKDAILIANKNKVQQVKQIVEHLKSENRKEYKEHKEIYQYWGKCDNIDNGYRYKVNKMTIRPGAERSFQRHIHHTEHWVVVSGTAKVTIEDKEEVITENQSLFIPIGVNHKIENPGKIPLEIIEVQSGSYLGDDDIIRLRK